MVGTTIVELEGVSGSIVLDSVLQEPYQGTTLMNDRMNGEFPALKPGANAISWTGAVTKAVVRPNWQVSNMTLRYSSCAVPPRAAYSLLASVQLVKSHGNFVTAPIDRYD